MIGLLLSSLVASETPETPVPELDKRMSVGEGLSEKRYLTAPQEEPKEKVKDSYYIDYFNATSPLADGKQLPGTHDLTGAKSVPVIDTLAPDCLATARIIADINSVQYPEGVSGPWPELNENVMGGKFR